MSKATKSQDTVKKLKALLTPCKTKDQLKNWIRYHLNMDVPDCTVSRYADTNPLDAIWSIYDVCVNRNNPDMISELLYVASRGSGKCAEKGTKILTSKGVKSIEDIRIGDTVFTGWSWEKVKNTFDEGVKPGLRVHTKSNTLNTPFCYTGTPHHRLQAINSENKVDWVHLEDLREGDWLYKSSETILVNTDSSDFSDGWLIGAISGDGNVCVVKDKANRITFCSEDFESLRHYANLVYERFKVKQKVKRNSKKSVNLTVNSKQYIEWFKQYVDGELAYDKHLKTLDHSYDFLAGFISGIMDTDGYRDGVDLANPKLIEQIGQILNIFGVSVSVNRERRTKKFSKIISRDVDYHSVTFKTRLPECLMPLFSKYGDFDSHRSAMNEQFRYPYEVVKPFLDTINNKLGRKNGYLYLPDGRIRKSLPYTKTWCDSYKSNFVYGYKLKALRRFFAELDMSDEVDQLDFILNGYFEQVSSIEKGDYYFYDLEIDHPRHAYWSNGFISHNTLGVAIAELMVMLHDQRDVVHVGAILTQAKRCYDYQMGFMLNDKLKPLLSEDIRSGDKILEKLNMEKSLFNLIDRFSKNLIKVSLEVLPCTLKAVNGPHVPLVVVDEIDTVSGEGLRAFKDIEGMLDSKGKRQGLRVGISTRKSRYGLMNKQIEEAEAAGRTVKYWTALEFTQRCPDERSGLDKTVGYVLQEDMEVITEDEFLKKAQHKQGEYFRNEFPGSKCLKCPIAALCLGDAKNQKSTSSMLKPISDPIKKAMSNGADWAISQLFNLKPSVEGIIYKEFDERKHVQTWNEMWLTLTGKEYPGECDHDTFVKKCFSSDTEVLTDSGFKLFSELSKHDLVASLDDKGNLIYEKPLDYIEKHYKGDMVNIYNKIGGKGKQLDLLLTPDHQQTYVSRSDIRNGKIKIHKKPLSRLPAGDFIIPSAPLDDSYDQPGFSSPISFMTDDQFYAFLGLWMAEGSMSSERANLLYKHNDVNVSQFKEGYWQKVEKLINSIEWPSKLRKKIDTRQDVGGSWHVYCKELYDYLRPYKLAPNKAIPREIINQASKRQLSILLEWAMLGDGANYDNDNKQQPYYGTSSSQLANDIQEIAFKLGYRTNMTTKYDRPTHSDIGTKLLPMYRVQIHSKKRNGQLRKGWYIKSPSHKSEFGETSKHFETIRGYDDKVYCVTMPSGRLFVRRNGVIALSGNCHQMQLSCYAGIDWGWTNPSTVVYFFVDNRENVYVVRCEGRTYTNNPTWVQTIKSKWHHMYRCQLYFPDMANPGDVVTMKQEGLPCPSKQTKDTPGGIQVVKKWLRSLASPVPKIFFARETCTHIIQEFLLYHYKTDAAGVITEDPAKEHDHWLDALRYAMYELFSNSTMVTSGYSDLATDKIVDDRGMFSRMPDAEEFARFKGLRVNTDIDTSKLGKIGKASELEDDDDSLGGDGAFLWSL